MSASAISKFLWGHRSKYKKENVHHKAFVEILGLLVVKNHLLIQFVEIIWLKCLVMQLWHCVVFPFKKNLEDLPNLVKKKKQTYVLLILAKCVFATTSFDLCMSKGAHNFECIVEGWGVNHGKYVQKVFMLQN
jgi:hypothetical protein